MYAEVIHGGHTISQTKIQDISGQLSRNGPVRKQKQKFQDIYRI
jgi:hypothetical protein